MAIGHYYEEKQSELKKLKRKLKGKKTDLMLKELIDFCTEHLLYTEKLSYLRELKQIDKVNEQNINEQIISTMMDASLYSEVINEIQLLLTKNETGYLYYKLGKAYRYRGENDKAIKTLKKAEELNYISVNLYSHMAFAYIELENHVEAIKCLKTQINNIDGDPSYIYQQMADCYMRLFEYNNAISCFEKVLKMEPGNYTLYLNLGICYHNLRDYDTSLRMYNKYIEAFAYDPVGHYNRGLTYESKGNYEEAKNSYWQSLLIQDDYLDSLKRLAYVYHQFYELESAIAIYIKILNINPKDLEMNLRYSDLLFQKEEYSKVIKILEDLSLIYPKSIEIMALLALCLDQLKEYEKALLIRREIEKLEPYYDNNCLRISKYYIRRKEYEQAKDELKKIYSDHTDITFYCTAITELIDNGEKEEVLLLYAEGKECLEHDAYLLLQIADLYMEDENYEEAIRIYNKSKYGSDVKTHSLKQLAKISAIKMDYNTEIELYIDLVKLSTNYSDKLNICILNYMKRLLCEDEEIVYNWFKDLQLKCDEISSEVSIMEILPLCLSACDNKNYRLFCDLMSLYHSIQNFLFTNILSIEDSKKKKFCHYTSLKTLNIIKDNDSAFRMYNTEYMNDPEEGVLLLNSMYKLLHLDEKDSNQTSLINYFNGCTLDNVSSTYIGCFTQGIDKIPIWGMYGDDGSGACCIISNSSFDFEFSPPQISSGLKVTRDKTYEEIHRKKYDYINEIVYKELHNLCKVTYISEEQIESNIINEWCAIINDIIKGIDKKNNDTITNIIISMISKVQYLFKNETYSYEEEYRLMKFFDLKANDIKIENCGDYSKLFIEIDGIEYDEVILGSKVKEPNIIKPALLREGKINKVSLSKVKYR